MNRYVLDASAILSMWQREPGGERVQALLLTGSSVMGTVNHAEVVAKLAMDGIAEERIRALMDSLEIELVPLHPQLAFRTGMLRQVTRHLGLSIGDRACLALAAELDATAITSDRPWLDLPSSLGIKVECIRPDSH